MQVLCEFFEECPERLKQTAWPCPHVKPHDLDEYCGKDLACEERSRSNCLEIVLKKGEKDEHL